MTATSHLLPHPLLTVCIPSTHELYMCVCVCVMQGWRSLGVDDVATAIGMPERLELKFTISGEEVILSRACATDADHTPSTKDPEFRLQYRKAGEVHFTSIGNGTAPARLEALEQVDDAMADHLYSDAVAPTVANLQGMNVRVSRALNNASPMSDVSSEYSTTSYQMRRESGGEYVYSPHSDVASLWSTESKSELSMGPATNFSPNKRTTKRTSTLIDRTASVTQVDRRAPARIASTRTPLYVHQRDASNCDRISRPHARKGAFAAVDAGFISAAEYTSLSSSSDCAGRPVGLAETWDLRPRSPGAVQSASSSNLMSSTASMPMVPAVVLQTEQKPQRRKKVPAWRLAVERERQVRKIEARKQFHPVLDAHRLRCSRRSRPA